MQVFTELPFVSTAQTSGLQDSVADVCGEYKQKVPADGGQTALWPDYFARRGQQDAMNWHYQGYWQDTWRIWKTYYRFVTRHPVVAFRGLRQFYASLVYRVCNEAVGDHATLPLAIATPALMALTPLLALAAVCIASLPVLRKRVPPLFQPFTKMGWTNYCIMLSLVFALHGYRQCQLRLHPAMATRHSAKTFWNSFFAAELPAGHFATQIHATCINSKLQGCLPNGDIILKPDSAGAGYKLRRLRWDAPTKQYVNDNAERQPNEARSFSSTELQHYLRTSGINMVVEKLERPRPPLPICTFRVLTLFLTHQPELICAAFLKAPENSVSTAYFELDTYLLDYEKNLIAEPLAPWSNGEMTGTPVPELTPVIRTCLELHKKLPEHAQISWDVLPAARGPVFLEGNVFPPGCDYKLTLFKNDSNFDYLAKRIITHHHPENFQGRSNS